MNIRRIGTAAGRWPRYNLIVDGIDVGSVRRTIFRGCDRLHPQGGSTHDGWRIHGVVCESRGTAERMLIERAVRAGLLDEHCLVECSTSSAGCHADCLSKSAQHWIKWPLKQSNLT